ncbi:MAG: inorganic phosphate transporter, partial [Bacteroidales bacterium]|nr:inorganic phosphate transporter [Bacteroidales bacterium]
LLGAAVAITIIKVTASGEGMESVGSYINSAKALAIISGILLSVVIAFTVGAIIQYIVRFVFTFDYAKTYKYFGAVWGGIAISAITYFILIKGAKGSSFLTAQSVMWIKDNTVWILLFSFVGWSILLQLVMRIFRVNILKIIVLIGTFALAMAFASNDLVNFIGVPLAGFESFKAFASSTVTEPGLYTMEALKEPVQTPTIFLLIAGLVMVGTLWFSRKARAVTKTELDLSRQDTGKERFESSAVARQLVGNAIGIANLFRIVLPKGASQSIERRFNQRISRKRLKKEGLSFDLVRASVNLVVASVLVAFGTSLKLPLSTTYVTFMVAMGTSLADRAWGRESAVNRITGVVAIIGGWFLTAFSAFTVAFIVALVIHFGGMIAISLLIALAIFFLFKTHTLHRKKEEEEKILTEIENLKIKEDGITIMESCDITVITSLFTISKIYSNIIFGFVNEKRKRLKKQIKAIEELNLEVQKLRDDLPNLIIKLREDEIDTGHIYVQVLDALKESSSSLNNIAKPIYNHLNNHRPPLYYSQKNDLIEFNEQALQFFNMALIILKNRRDYKIDLFLKQQRNLLKRIKSLNKNQIKMIRREEIGTKISVLSLNTMSESKNLFLHTVNLVKAHRDFLRYSK